MWDDRGEQILHKMYSAKLCNLSKKNETDFFLRADPALSFVLP